MPPTGTLLGFWDQHDRLVDNTVVPTSPHTHTIPTLPDAEKPDEDLEGEELFEPATPT